MTFTWKNNSKEHFAVFIITKQLISQNILLKSGEVGKNTTTYVLLFHFAFEHRQTSKIERFAKKYFRNTLHLRCWTWS